MIEAMRIAATGMRAAATRMEVSASNVANVATSGRVETPQSPSDAYRPLAVTQQAGAGGVSASVGERSAPFRLAYDPTSPDADADGMVAMPAVDLAGEAVEQLTAKIAYEASVKTFKIADEMAREALDILS